MVRLVITDLDDTLYSWIGFFVPAFYAMTETLSQITDIPVETLLKEYKAVHQEANNLEYPYSTLKLPSICDRTKGMTDEERKAFVDPAFHAFNSIRLKNLTLYPGVKEAFESFQNNGIKIIGYTESFLENGPYRLDRLGIGRYFHKIYVLKGKNINQTKDDRIIETENRKPSPELLHQIIQLEGLKPEECIYIGDSLPKDMLMAKEAGVRCIWLRCSINNEQEYRKKISAISHWTEEMEKQNADCIRRWKEKGYVPDYTAEDFYRCREIVEEEEA